jgi:peptide/nickel transport system substrate-binding protein
VHQSGTVGNIGTQGCMFDNLIRRDPRDSGKTIIPDLAHSWEIANTKIYAFHLRQGVQFHNGTDFTSADVKATFDRIAKPPAGVRSRAPRCSGRSVRSTRVTSTPSNSS